MPYVIKYYYLKGINRKLKLPLNVCGRTGISEQHIILAAM